MTTSLLCGALALSLIIVAAPAAERYRLAPYKDELFKYPKVLESKFDGDYLKVEFDYERDVLARDERPDEKTRAEYVSLDVKSAERELVLNAPGTSVKYFGVGATSGKARSVVIFIHGWQATGKDGVNDWRSGGNLNRIKNLMVRNGGAYLSPDFSTSRPRAKKQIAALVEEFARNSPGAPIFLACASAGARVCWDLVEDPATADRLAGILLIAAVSDADFVKSPAVTGRGKPVPIYMGHGTRDQFVNWRPQERLFRSIKSAAPDYPIRLVLFETGSHRTPLRMTDWRLVLNWMLEVNGK